MIGGFLGNLFQLGALQMMNPQSTRSRDLILGLGLLLAIRRAWGEGFGIWKESAPSEVSPPRDLLFMINVKWGSAEKNKLNEFMKKK